MAIALFYLLPEKSDLLVLSEINIFFAPQTFLCVNPNDKGTPENKLFNFPPSKRLSVAPAKRSLPPALKAFA
ncbi:hypothetical protein H6H03_10505 [Nostoc paludosum FACHB-159]|uniref:Uncharacterized protein n=1 Tax=Nostoc paludosum FACHB-159 TaxID=2692908 RepID=A0ABR8K4F8_9NOSO|nr:hypothetical protein [Nostoc paludosum FACHB-159]